LSFESFIFSMRKETAALGSSICSRGLLGLLVVVDVKFDEALAGCGEGVEVRRRGCKGFA
jgi:hypothetical protein